MDDVKEIVSKMTVTVSEEVTEIFRQNKVDCRQFLESNLSGFVSCTVDKVGSTYRLTGSYEGIKHIRMELTKKLKEMLAADETQHLQGDSLQNIKDNDRQESTREMHDDVGDYDAKPPPLPSHISLQFDVIDNQSQSTSHEMTKQVSPQKPKRIRKLKSQTSDGENPMEAKAQGFADDGSVLDDEMRKLIDSGNYVIIEVDKDRHQYLMTHFGNDLKKQLPPPFSFVDADGGNHKVAFAVDSKKGGVNEKNITAKYTSYLSRFQFEIVDVPEGVDGSVFCSLFVTTDNNRNLSVVLDKDNKSYKLIGSKKEVDRIKRRINEHVMAAKEELQRSKEAEGDWKVKYTKKKGGKRTASNLSFLVENGKLNRNESPQSQATKNCSLQVTLFEWKTKAPTTEAVVRAIDGKMHGFGDTIQFEGGKRYKEECSKIFNECHGSLLVGQMVDTPATGALPQNMKVKYIVHIVLDEKVQAASTAAKVTAMKDVIYRCLHHADNGLQTKSIAFPHLGGSEYCDIASFVRGSIQALQSFTNHHLQRVSFVAKDSKTLQELEREFESCIDYQQGSQST